MSPPDASTAEMARNESNQKAPAEDATEKFLGGDDVGAAVFHGATIDIDVTGPEARRVLRKIDLHVLPLLCFTYLIQFLDKSCVSYAALWGMKEDAHLTGQDYSWLTTIFYIGYLFSEFPTNLIFQKFNIARTCGIFITLWGAVLLCMSASNTFAGLVTVRLFMGILEAGVSPCFVLMTAMFYKRNEQPVRTSIWFSMNGMANILGGLISYGIGYIKAGILVWKFPFIIFGSITVAWGVLFTLVAPANPTEAKWLSEDEKAIAILRLVENETGIDNKKFKWYQAKEALVDIKFWLFNLLVIANCIPNGSISAFGPLIVNGFGYTTFQSTLLNMPSGAAQILGLWISGYLASRFNDIRHFLMIGGVLVALLGGALIYALPETNKVGRLFGYYILAGFSVTFVLSLNLVQSNVAGRTKKTIFASSVFISYCVGNLIGPQLFFAREAPRYQSGFISMIVCFGVQVFIIATLFFLSLRDNRRRDQATSDAHVLDASLRIAIELSDLTDRENQHFRYAL